MFSTSVGRIGLGIGTTAAAYSDTNLTTQTGWTGNNWILCGAAPTYTAATGGTPASMVFTATFSTANYNAGLVTERLRGRRRGKRHDGDGRGERPGEAGERGRVADQQMRGAWNATATLAAA